MAKQSLKGLVIFGTSAHPELMEKVCGLLRIHHGRYLPHRFPNFNSLPQLTTPVKDCHVVVMHAFPPVVEVEAQWAEAKKLIRASQEWGAREITLLLSYFSYARSHRRTPEGIPLAAKLYAQEAKLAGADRVIVVVLHNLDFIDAFGVPVVHLGTKHQLVRALSSLRGTQNFTLVAPDEGRRERIEQFATDLGLPFTWGVKIHPSPTTTEIIDVRGELREGVLVIDDEMNTGGTIESLFFYILNHYPKVKRIIFAFTHGVLCGKAVERLNNILAYCQEQGVKFEILLTDSLPLPATKRLPNMKIVSIAPMLAEVIKSIHLNEEINPRYLY